MPVPPGGNGGTMPAYFHQHLCYKGSLNDPRYLAEVEGSPAVVRRP